MNRLFNEGKGCPVHHSHCGDSGHPVVSASAKHFTHTVSFNPTTPLFKLYFLHFAGVGCGTQWGCYLSGLTVCVSEGPSQLDTDPQTPECLLGEQEKTAPGKLHLMVWVLSLSKCLGLWGQKGAMKTMKWLLFFHEGLPVTNSISPLPCFLPPDYIILLALLPPFLKRRRIKDPRKPTW